MIIISRTSVAEKEKSPPRPPSILKKRPMAALRSDAKAQKTEKSHLEYRIIVSNLRNTVTGGDIEVGLFKWNNHALPTTYYIPFSVFHFLI